MTNEMQIWINDVKKCYRILDGMSKQQVAFLANKSGLLIHPQDDKDRVIRKLLCRLQITLPINIDFSE